MTKLLLALFLLFNTAHADSIQLPNLSKAATGTSLGAGKYALDVTLPPGALSVIGSVPSGSIFGSTDFGLLTLSVRKDSTGPLTGVADGDYTPLQVDANGNLKTANTEVATAANGALGLPSLLKVIGGFDGTNVRAIRTSATGVVIVDGSAVTQPISAAALPLPTGAATSANQTTSNSSLASIDGKLASLGQKAMSGSVPVVLASDQSAITVTGTVTTSNTANGNTGSAVPTVATQVGGSDGTNLRALSVNSSGQLNINNISGTVSLPTGAATSANQTTSNSSLSSIDGKTPALGQALMASSSPVVIASNQSAISVTGPLTDAQLRATAVPVSAASLPLPSGAATESTLSTLSGKIPSNLTVTSTRLLVDGSGVTQPVSAASLPLPSGAATETTLASLKATAGSAAPTSGVFLVGTDGTTARAIKTNASGELVVGVTTSTPSTSTFVETTVDATTASVNSPPANCRGFQLWALESNSANLRVRYGSTSPTVSVGVQLQPGRSIDYVPACPTIRLLSESGTNEFMIAWFTD